MDRLPNEVILQIIAFLDVPNLVPLQLVSTRYLHLGRDDAIWKQKCFDHSQAEALRRRQRLLNVQDARLAELRNAMTALPGAELTAWDVSQLRGSLQPRASNDPQREAKEQETRALANWEPAYPAEQLDYYEEYLHRHAPINVGWLDLPKAQTVADKEEYREATGIGTINDGDGTMNHVVAPLDDGSICIWNVSAGSTTTSGGRGRLLAQSKAGLLSGQAPDSITDSHIFMTETGAVECVAVDSPANKAYFAVQNLLHEVDLFTLSITSTKHYPFPITALSSVHPNTPLTVGTNMTIHLHDPRDTAFSAPPTSGELIGGSPYTHATLTQPGPLSILHEPHHPTSLWVAGRFTSLLNYDLRTFPRLQTTIHSGARIACLSSLPFPLIPRSLDLIRNPSASISSLLEARSAPGATTILAAAEYKGKGSLELYGLPRVAPYQNRQTASASKLLSVAPHAGRIVFSDGDGNLKWMERDGFSFVRTFNINDAAPASSSSSSSTRQRGQGQQQDYADASEYGIWSSSASELPGQGDIVQKIVPTHPVHISQTFTSSKTLPDSLDTIDGNAERQDINTNNLLLWTADGRIGMLGFGHSDPLRKAYTSTNTDINKTNGDSRDGEKEDNWHEAMESTAENARRDAERQYGMAMRTALQRNADEVRFVRGLGMGYES